MSELKLRPPKTQTRISFGCLFLLFDGDSELVQLIFINRRRRIGHQILGGGGCGEGDHFADRFFAGEEHDHAVDAEGDAAVRRSAIRQRVEEKAEPAAKLLFAKAERPEETLLNVLAVDSNAAGTELVAIQHELTAF